MSDAAVIKEMGLVEPPKAGRELYTELLRVWRQNGCETLKDVAMYYLDVCKYYRLRYKMRRLESLLLLLIFFSSI